MFDKLDINKYGTLDLKELHGRLSHKEFTTADADHDGTLSIWEFHTPKGRALTRLLRSRPL